MRCDLHTHSTASDGLLTPTELARAAHAAELTTIALTDHDTTEGVAEAQAAGSALGLHVIPGVEINTDLRAGGEAHVLGYFVPLADPVFQQELATRRAARLDRGQRMVAQLRKIGLPITWEQVLRHADGAVGRPHVAAALIDLGVVQTVAEAFDTYLARGKAGYVPRAPYAPEEAIALIRQAGGVASLAHPAYIASLDSLLPRLVAAGLTGLETYYGQYNPENIRYLSDLATRFGLIPTGGSDYHGPGIHPTPLGAQPTLPEASLEALRTAAAVRH